MDIAVRTFFRVPVIGWLVRDAIRGAPDAKYYFVANLLFAFVLLVYKFGYPFLIVSALTATAIGLVSLVFLTAADLFDQGNRRKRRPE
jgi:hypothetical protein